MAATAALIEISGSNFQQFLVLRRKFRSDRCTGFKVDIFRISPIMLMPRFRHNRLFGLGNIVDFSIRAFVVIRWWTCYLCHLTDSSASSIFSSQFSFAETSCRKNRASCQGPQHPAVKKALKDWLSPHLPDSSLPVSLTGFWKPS